MPPQKPKVLFLAYYFPPLNAGACVRTWNIAKYLSRLGWDVTVVTPDPHLWRLGDTSEIEKIKVELNKEGIKCKHTGHDWRFLSPGCLKFGNTGIKWFLGGVGRRIASKWRIEREIGWIKEAKRTCSTLGKEDVDIILASGSPFCSFGLAKWLSDKLNRPYVLDYRDPWTGNPHATYPKPQKTINEEKELLQSSAAVTIVSPSWAMDLTRRYGLKEKIHVISNGFDPDEMSQVQPTQFPHFAIVYTGDFYPPKRVITPFMEALKHLKELRGKEKGKWCLYYYGQMGEHVREEAERFGMIDEVKLQGKVHRNVALSAVAGADISIVITSIPDDVTIADKGMITCKVFESLGLRTPILLICPLGSDVAILEQCKGVRAFQKNNIVGMASYLNQRIESQGERIEGEDSYSWVNLSKQLNDILLKNL
ncbi:glycosyltransferase [Candidatus Nitrospira allomarina]|uniref:Glycosyltransferase n=1 Tax=Candidatus Nitrospira allomarina TaxID=3020900 RepID=A0AA96GBT6_9BACT|nr:glycosyltransferase [Candidatus Nitrospira allomarina]WNM58132.1 glycosyltransferase [Candidatus Nitrospira allomarina]